MIYNLISLVVFAFTTICHIFLHRLLAKLGIRTFKSVSVYGLGLIFIISLSSFNIIKHLFYNKTGTLQSLPIPITGIVLYSLLSILNIMFFTSPYMGNISPSYKILLLIKNSRGLSKKAILKSFSDQELIGKRLNNLVLDGFLQRNKKLFKILPKGQKLVSVIDYYRSWLKWKSSG